jgi:hypothetical protein
MDTAVRSEVLYTVKVDGHQCLEVLYDSIRPMILFILESARLGTRGQYVFKLIRRVSSHTAPEGLLRFEHDKLDSVYLYPCLMSGLFGLKGTFRAGLMIPELSLRSGIVDDLNRAAAQFLKQHRDTVVPDMEEKGKKYPSLTLQRRRRHKTLKSVQRLQVSQSKDHKKEEAPCPEQRPSRRRKSRQRRRRGPRARSVRPTRTSTSSSHSS